MLAMNAADSSGFRDLIATADLPPLGPGPRPGVQGTPELMLKVNDFLEARNLSGSTAQALRAAALLWHDHLDESHRISQTLHDANGSFLHGIMHRREPDYSNAKYWFRQTGPHPAYAEISRRAAELLKGPSNAPLAALVLPNGRWNPAGFVDACEKAPPLGSAPRAILEQIQAIEFEALLEQL